MIKGSKYYKFFGIKSMLRIQEHQISLLNAFSIHDLAHRLELKNIMPLIGLVKGVDHMGLVLPHFKINLREYLIIHRDPAQLPMITTQMINGV
jgi:hypothetical protein